ncbi:hypothetical protein R1flu_009207 [Riccia fluitans]|uniref:Ubiquitin-like protease family profile domain-containing protein n=1 Tax=Riccia fluitans TaxID=41844 RepID=A0ABD1Z1P0_9MARC
MSRQEAKAIARSQKETTTHLGQSSANPSNHMEGIDVHRGQLATSLQTTSASMAEYKNTIARMLEECERAIERNTSLEEELVIAQRKIDKLEQRRLVLTTVHKALSEWRVDNLLPVTSFITGHRLLASDVDRAGVETSYILICNNFKLVAASHHNPQLFYEHLKSIFDSYVNHDNNPDVQPLLKGLDVEVFDVDAFLGIDMGGRKEEMTPDFLNGISVHDVRRLESEIENICREPQRVTRATARLRLNYEQDVLPPPTAKENVTDSTVVPTVGCSIDLTTDEAMDEPDVINALMTSLCNFEKKKLNFSPIFEKFLQRSHEELFNMFYCSTFWFAKASQQVDAYDMTSHSKSASIGIKRMRNAIYPQLCDGDFKVHPEVPAWIFVPIHGRCHWSLALIRLLGTTCAMTHLDSFRGIHKKEYIFHVLRTFLRLTMPICPKTIVCGTMEVPHQLDQYSCGIHIIQMLAGAGMKGLGLDQCWRVEKLAWIATIDQVTIMGIMLSGWLNGKFKHVP